MHHPKALLNGARIGTLLALLCYIPADSFQSLLLVTLVLHVTDRMTPAETKPADPHWRLVP
jgi:hypothetical protein